MLDHPPLNTVWKGKLMLVYWERTSEVYETLGLPVEPDNILIVARILGRCISTFWKRRSFLQFYFIFWEIDLNSDSIFPYKIFICKRNTSQWAWSGPWPLKHTKIMVRLNLVYKSNDRSPKPSCMERMKKISHYLMASNILQNTSIKLCSTVVSYPLREWEVPGSIPPRVRVFLFSCRIFFIV